MTLVTNVENHDSSSEASTANQRQLALQCGDKDSTGQCTSSNIAHGFEVLRGVNALCLKVELSCQLSNSPDLYVLDLCHFNAIQSLQHQ